jgi:magnesium transporter
MRAMALKLSIIRNGAASLADVSMDDVHDCLQKKDGVVWIDATGPSFQEIDELGKIFKFHPLSIEDAHLRHQRPKIDQYDAYFFIVFYAMAIVDDAVKAEEIDFFVGERYVVTVHQLPLAVLGEVQQRWTRNTTSANGGAGSSGVLLYSILDAIVDAYFPIIDYFGDELDRLEEEIFTTDDLDAQRKIFSMKRNLLSMRKLLGPERDVMNVLVRRDTPIFEITIVVYMQDVYDHILRVSDALDTYRDIVTGALDAYLSMTSNRLIVVMKRMTASSIILMTVTIVASIYGMNFTHMPELDWRLGYPMALGIMAGAAGVLIYLFKKIDYL